MPKRVSSVTVRLDEPVLASVVANYGNQAAYRIAQKVRGRVLSNMRSTGRIDTGRMIRETQVRKDDAASTGLIVAYTISTTAVDPRNGFPYPIVQEKGSRGHGPRTAPFMVFTPKGGSHPIRVRYVRGVTAANFFRDAAQSIRPADALP